jgi:hypothetical protein
VYRHVEPICREEKASELKITVLRANRRSFDCASRDEAARGSAQDDKFYLQHDNFYIHPGFQLLYISV